MRKSVFHFHSCHGCTLSSFAGACVQSLVYQNMSDTTFGIPVGKNLHTVRDSLFTITWEKYAMKRLQAFCIYAGHCIPFLLCSMLIYIGKVPLTCHLSTVYFISRCCWHLVCCFHWQITCSKCYTGNAYNMGTHFISKPLSIYCWLYFMTVLIFLFLFFLFFFFFLFSFEISSFVHTAAGLQLIFFVLVSPQVHAAMFSWWLMSIPAKLQMSRQKRNGNDSCFFFPLSCELRASQWGRVSSPQMLPLMLSLFFFF